MDVLTIIKRIEMRLSELGMSKSDFYKQTGISSASFSQWRSGLYKPSEKKLAKAAECLEISLEYLINGYVEEGRLSLASGVNVFRCVNPERVMHLMQDLEPNSYRIVYQAPGIVITVDNSTKLSEEEINNFVSSYSFDATEHKKAPTPKSERDGSEILFALSRGGQTEITDEMYEEVKRFAEYVAQRQKEK